MLCCLCFGVLCFVGRHLVKLAIEEMIAQGAQEISLEAEVTNTGALRLYESLGFLRDKRLHRYFILTLLHNNIIMI